MGLFNKKDNKPNSYSNDSRLQRQRKKRVVLLLILSTIILVLAMFSFIIFNQAITSCKNSNVDDPDETTTGAATDTTDSTTKVKKSFFSCTGSKNNSDDTTTQAEQKSLTYNPDKYALKNSEDIKKGELLLIDNNHLYQFPDSTPNIYSFRDKRTVFPDGVRSIQAVDTEKPKLDITAINALNAMADAFYVATTQTGLQAKFGYCTKEQQQGYFDIAVAEYSTIEKAKLHEALAGGTEHNTGLAIDLGIYIDPTTYKLNDATHGKEYTWIFENCYKYGFILRYPDSKASITGVDYEPFHFRYVGYEHAFYMYKNNLCFEEYLNLLRTSYTCTTDDVATAPHLKITGDNEIKYEIYYVAASSGMTTIPVPDNAPYTISGDNVSGFIVTVTVG